MRMSGIFRNNNNSDNALTSRRINGGKKLVNRIRAEYIKHLFVDFVEKIKRSCVPKLRIMSEIFSIHKER